ncbi:MAG: OmpA family protein [Candidatus Coatesbacteria bacterium]
MTHLRNVLRALATGSLAVWLAGCATPPVKPAPEPAPAPAPVVQEAPKPPPPKPLEFDKIYFTYDRAEVPDAARDALKRAADALLERADASVNIEGHCDERGTDEYNIDLGWKRAYAIRDYLKRMGIDEKRMYPISYGRARPAVIGSDESAWSRNRRVEIVERK